MTTPPNDHIVAEVRAQAAKRRITQDRLADILNLSRMSISRRMNGAVPFTTDELVRLAAQFGVPVSTFFESMPTPSSVASPSDNEGVSLRSA